MKRFLLTGMLAFGALAPAAFAQSGGYEDDIYSNSTPRRAQRQDDADDRDDRYQQDGSYSSRGNGNTASGNNGGYRTDSRNYSADDYDYIDYDDYSYSSRFRRFNDPFYNVGYWSSFGSPWGYDPFWGPGWGSGWGGGWGRPGITVSVGYGGPYWSSYWGVNNWWGYSGFSSCWGYPQYASWGWGGGGYWNGYQNGYWNGYYAGLYGAGYGSPYGGYGGYRRAATYGPRSTMGGNPYNYNGFRTTAGDNLRQPVAGPSYGPRDNMRRSDSRVPVVNENGQPVQDSRNGNVIGRRGSFQNGELAPRADNNADAVRERPVAAPSERRRSGWFSDNNTTNDAGRTPAAGGTVNRPQRNGWFGDNNGTAAPVDRSQQQQQQVERPRRSGWFSNDNSNIDRTADQPVRRADRGGWFDRGAQQQRAPQQVEQPRQQQWGGGREAVGGGFERPQRTFEQPRMQQQPQQRQPSFEQPRMSAPRMESMPRMSAPSGNFGGGGGGGFRRR